MTTHDEIIRQADAAGEHGDDSPRSVVAPRRRRAGVPRVAPAHVVMVLAGLLGGLLTLAILRSGDATTTVAVAARDLTVGETLRATDLDWIEVGGDARARAALVMAGGADAVIGSVLTIPVATGALVPRDGLRPAASADLPRALSFAIERSRALAGAVAAGDRIDVLAADRDGQSEYVVADVEVLAVDDGATGPLGAGGELTVTLALDADDALALAGALEITSVSLVRSTGAAPTDRSEASRAP